MVMQRPGVREDDKMWGDPDGVARAIIRAVALLPRGQKPQLRADDAGALYVAVPSYALKYW